LNELLLFGKTNLKEAGIEEAELDAWYLLEYVTGIGRAQYLCDRKQLCEESQAKRYQTLIEKRAAHMPLSYLTGEREFMGLSFLVNQDVLIPRQDTEILVEETLKFLKPDKKVLEIGTGSGCILLSLAHFCKLKKAVGTDISQKALEVAKVNEKRIFSEKEPKMTIEWLQSDLFEKVEERFDCIVSNPPYIKTEVICSLAEEVKNYEPHNALDGKEDGLYFYRILSKQAKDYLNSGGFLCLEIGFDQGEEVGRLLRENGFLNVQIKKDLAGLDRVCTGYKK